MAASCCKPLTYWGRVTHICVIEINHHGLRLLLWPLLMKFQSNLVNIHKNIYLICSLQDGDHFVPASVCWMNCTIYSWAPFTNISLIPGWIGNYIDYEIFSLVSISAAVLFRSYFGIHTHTHIYILYRVRYSVKSLYESKYCVVDSELYGSMNNAFSFWKFDIYITMGTEF